MKPTALPQAGDAIGPPRAGFGLGLFGLYALLFAAFVVVNIVAPEIMTTDSVPISAERTLTLRGMNLAVVLGISLILFAMLGVLIFMRLTRQRRH